MEDYPKVDLFTRILAVFIDGALSAVVGFIPFIGPIIGGAYMLLKDGLFEGQSLGKKVMKLQVMTSEGNLADYMASVRRNAIFAIPILIMIIPIIGWIIAPILSLIIVIVELMKVINDPHGLRIGDSWAGTQVINMQESTAEVPPVPPVVENIKEEKISSE